MLSHRVMTGFHALPRSGSCQRRVGQRRVSTANNDDDLGNDGFYHRPLPFPSNYKQRRFVLPEEEGFSERISRRYRGDRI